MNTRQVEESSLSFLFKWMVSPLSNHNLAGGVYLQARCDYLELCIHVAKGTVEAIEQVDHLPPPVSQPGYSLPPKLFPPVSWRYGKGKRSS